MEGDLQDPARFNHHDKQESRQLVQLAKSIAGASAATDLATATDVGFAGLPCGDSNPRVSCGITAAAPGTTQAQLYRLKKHLHG